MPARHYMCPKCGDLFTMLPELARFVRCSKCEVDIDEVSIPEKEPVTENESGEGDSPD